MAALVGVPVVIDIPAPERLLTTNSERTLFWRERARIVKVWRQAAWAYGVQARHRGAQWDQVRIEATPIQKTGKMADPGGHNPIVKACIDGLVDAGVIPNDTPAHVTDVVQHSPERGPAALRLLIYPLSTDPLVDGH